VTRKVVAAGALAAGLYGLLVRELCRFAANPLGDRVREGGLRQRQAAERAQAFHRAGQRSQRFTAVGTAGEMSQNTLGFATDQRALEKRGQALAGFVARGDPWP
jgi:hypothetical protein